ncbi:MAG: SCO family protein [Acidobacteriota bacterium]|jgi:protein SCO1/2
MSKRTQAALALLLLGVSCPAIAAAQDLQINDVINSIGIDQHLGAELPGDLSFRDEAGKTIALGDLFTDRPVILVPVYYECPMLCDVTLDGLTGALKTLDLNVGEDFDVITVSIDPGETPELAAANEKKSLERYGRGGATSAAGWHALVGDPAAVDTLMKKIGFRYVYDEGHDQYAHASGLMVVTPGRKLARYLYGVEYSGRDLELSLTEASQGTVGSLADQVLLLCYHYDPTTGRYGLVIWNVIRLLGFAVVVLLGTSIAVMLRHERNQQEATDV